MSKVFNMVGGGGGKNISSIIITGLKSTDTITCTKDGKSYIATWDETAQHWEIVGLPLGTFTLTATDGTHTKTETILIDITGVYEIEMDYNCWLYRNGDECEDISGGWSVNDNINWANYSTRGFVSKGETIKLWANSNNRVSAVQTSNPIDLTGFSKLVFRFGNPSGTSSIAFGFASTTSGNINENYLVPPAKYMWGTTTPVNTYELDISSLNGFYYATFAFVSSGSSSDASSAELEYAYLFD